jgi:hypothetical protein
MQEWNFNSLHNEAEGMKKLSVLDVKIQLLGPRSIHAPPSARPDRCVFLLQKLHFVIILLCTTLLFHYFVLICEMKTFFQRKKW